MTTTNLNLSPYFDDYKNQVVDSGNYEHTKGFNQVLFKPGYAVQARELTQLQSILKDQIAQFGSHIFKHGSVVIPGNVSADLNVCYVKLDSTDVDVTTLENLKITGETSGLVAFVRKAISEVSGVSPPTLYVSYYNTGNSGENLFLVGETLLIDGSLSTLTVSPVALSVGGASMAFITRGVFFINGSFVPVEKQSVVIDNSATPTKSIRLKITESIISSDSDVSLFDPAQGSNNFAAPGADRLKVELTLVSEEPSTNSITESYVELMRYNAGVLEEHLRYAKYNELEKSLARRTYDESGNYVVSGLNISTREHLRSTVNNGKFLPEDGGDESKLIVSVSAGKAYINGYEVESIATKDIAVNKARDFETVQTSTVPSYGQYIFVTNPVSLPDFKNRETITLYNSATAGSVMGTAKVMAIDLYESIGSGNDSVWKLFISDVNITTGGLSDIGKATFTNGSFTVVHKYTVSPTTNVDFTTGKTIKSVDPFGVATEALVHEYVSSTRTMYAIRNDSTKSIPGFNGIITEYNVAALTGASGKITSTQSVVSNAGSSLLFPTNSVATKSLTNNSNAVDISYKIYNYATVVTSASPVNIDVTGMTIDPIEQGNINIVDDDGIVYSSTVASLLTDTRLQINVTPTVPVNLYVTFTCTKSGPNGNYSLKTLTTVTDAALSPLVKVMLAQADGVTLNKVVSTVDGDVTARYSMNSGQTDYEYGLAYITLNSGSIIPGGVLSVTYTYFNHTGSADYFCIDSYVDSGLPDFYKSSTLTYISKDTGNRYDLRNTIDFRTKSTATRRFIPQIDSRISTSVQAYLPRIDSVVCDQSGLISIITGKPKLVPAAPTISLDVIHLGNYYLQAYTANVLNIDIQKINNKAYTMAAIGRLDARIQNVEEYVLLSQTESDLVNYEVIDAATGLNRYKAGYLVDTFDNADKISDIGSKQFTVSYESETIIPQFESMMSHLIPTPSGLDSVSITGEIISGEINDASITLPYENVIMTRQPVSSKVTNINPFAVFSWVGVMTVVPSSDSWTVQRTNPNVIIETSSETVDNIIFIDRPTPTPVIIPANIPPVEVSTTRIITTFGTSSGNINTTPAAPVIAPRPNVLPFTAAQNAAITAENLLPWFQRVANALAQNN